MTRALVANLGEAVYKQTNVFTDLPKIAAPFTTIVGRALVTDFANDALPRFGVNRVMLQSIQEVQGEFGPAGERVFKPINDIHDAVRFVGTIGTDPNGANGQLVVLPVGNFIEIVFYGTALNLLTYKDASVRDLSVSVDGGAPSTVSLTPVGISSVLTLRNVSANSITSIVTGLSQGLHTVKLTAATNTSYLNGYETLNTVATLQLVPGSSYNGSRKLITPALSTSPYNSSFASGTLGIRGGHVAVYQKADGTIAKAVTPTDAASAFLTSASHTNEELVRTYHWREFGAGRSEDFSFAFSASANRAFTLDDGTTTLTGNLIDSNTLLGLDLLRIPANDTTRSFIFTFVGTGCDLVAVDHQSGAYVMTVSVDGATVGTLTTASTALRTIKIASGLPYGTHTVKILGTSGTPLFHLHQFITYGPSKPAIPSGAVELSDYYILADYVADLTYGNAARVSTGVLRKVLLREATYSGTWAVASIDPGFGSGINLRSQTAASYVELFFVGTGISYRPYLTNLAYNFTFAVDGAAPTGSTFTYQGTGLTYTAGTGVLSGTAAGAASYAGGLWQITGLTFGVHKLRVTCNSTGDFLYADDFDVITPIHSPKFNFPGVIQNTLPVGSQGLNDSRKFSPQLVKPLANWAQAVGITSGATSTSTALVPAPDMSVTLKTTGNPVSLYYFIRVVADASGRNMQAALFVDGVQVSSSKAVDTASANFDAFLTDSVTVPVAAGVHKIDVYWLISAGTITAKNISRNLTARET